MLTEKEMEIAMDAISEAIITKLLAAILESRDCVARRELIAELCEFRQACAITIPPAQTYKVTL